MKLRNSSKRLMLIHFIAVGVIIVSGLSGLFLILNLTSLHTDDAKSINISGKQRYLSQKSIILLEQYLEMRTAEIHAELLSHLRMLQENHKLLSQNIPEKGQQIFDSVEEKIKDFEALALHISKQKNPSSVLQNQFRINAHELYELFEEATMLTEKSVAQKIEKLQHLIILMTIFLLIAIVVEALFVVKPALLKIEEKSKSLEKSNEDLQIKIDDAVERNRQNELLLLQKNKASEVGELINNIAHQWKQPLNILSVYIITMLHKIEYSPSFDKEKIVENLKLSQETIAHMTQTIEDFRNFFKPHNQQDVFDALSTIKSTQRLLYEHFLHYDIKLKMLIPDDYEPKDYQINGKKGELEQCLLILLNNAKDAILGSRTMKPKCGNITVSLSRLQSNISIKISDDGRGIAQNIADKLFKTYVTSKGENGTGIGLYMCHNIITQRFGGSISFENHEQGACFQILVPCVF